MFEILSVGSHTCADGRKFSFTQDDLEKTANLFNSARQDLPFKAPFVPGHPENDQPQCGLPTRLAVQGSKLLVTQYEQLDPTFAAVVNSGELSRVSVKLRPPTHPENKTGAYLIRHIGFLGRSEPAVGDLSEVRFSKEQGDVNADFELSVSTSPRLEILKTMPDEDQKKQADEAEFARRQQELEAREREIAKQEANFKRATVSQRVEALVPKKVLPAQKERVLSLALALPSQDIEFSQGSDTVKESPLDALFSILGSIPDRVDMTKDLAGSDDIDTVEVAFSAPAGAQIDKASLGLHGKALAYQKQHPESTYIQAVKAVGG